MAISPSLMLSCILQEFDGKKSSAFEREGFCPSISGCKKHLWKSLVCTSGEEGIVAWDSRDVVSPWLKYSLVTGKRFSWDRESRFPSAAEIMEGLISSILDTVK